MAEQLPAIIVITPLFASLVVLILGMWRHSFALPITVLGIGLTLAASINQLIEVILAEGNQITYYLGGWDNPIPIGIHLSVDPITAIVVVVISLVGFITTVYSLVRVPEETPEKIAQFYCLFLLLICGLLGMTVSADAFNVFVLLEVSSLTSYALIAMGDSKRAGLASFNYVIMGTIGASFYLLGVGYLLARTGSLNMADIQNIISSQNLYDSASIHVAFIFIVLGLMIKMAFFPLHGWLPNAYSYSPSSSACILAPLVTKVSIYVTIRMILTVFGPAYVFQHLGWSDVIVWLAVVSIVAGSVLALSQKELKKMFCYLIVAEVGYMVGGIWMANHWGMVGAIYHIVSDAMMTLCLFLAASMIWRQTRSHQISSLSELTKKMPFTMAGLIVGALAMIGVPPTCGFFSKWFLIRGGIEAGHWGYVVALLFSSLVNAILFFRVIEMCYFGKKPAEGHDHHDDAHGKKEKWTEAPPAALFALLSTASLLVLIGVFNDQIVKLIKKSLIDLPIVGIG